MAVATATITVFPYPKGHDNTQRSQIVRGTIAISTGTYPAGGFALSWNTSSTTGGTTQAIPIPASTPSSTSTPAPFDVDIKSAAYRANSGGIGGPSGYIYLWDSVNGNLHVFESANGASNSSGPLLEIGGNIPGDVVNDSIQFTAWFYRN